MYMMFSVAAAVGFGFRLVLLCGETILQHFEIEWCSTQTGLLVADFDVHNNSREDVLTQSGKLLCHLTDCWHCCTMMCKTISEAMLLL